MKKVLLTLLAGTLVLLPACSSDDDNTGGNDISIDKKELNQNLYADESNVSNGVSITTTGAWISSIKEKNKTKSTSPEWISMDPSEGSEAGDYTINIILENNYSGEDRTAEITIRCNESYITITVTQKGKKEDGTVPEEPRDHFKRYVKSIKFTDEHYGSDYTYFEYDDKNRVSKITFAYAEESYENSITTFTYSNNHVSYKHAENGKESAACTGTITLNSNNYTSSGSFLCYGKDEGSWTTTYNNGYLTNVSGIYDDGQEKGISYNNKLEWSDKNMIYFESTGTEDNDNATLTYSTTVPNNPSVNLDLNWLITGIENLAFVVEGCVDAHTIYPFAMGYYGKRSNNMLHKVSGTDSSYQVENTYTYHTDSEGYITKIDIENRYNEVTSYETVTISYQ